MSILYFFAKIFGYVLNFLYQLIGNYGVAIILFSILVKLLTIPISIKQQRTMKKSAKIQEEMKQIQFKYKNDPEKMNQEVMALYKRENMSPFSGCLSSIVQIILLLAVFILVQSPLTYMVKLDSQVINQLDTIANQSQVSNSRYKEIQVIQYVRTLKNEVPVNEEEQDDNYKLINQYKDKVNLNMDFLGIDLSAVPTQNLSDWKTLVIPILYVITSFVSIRMTTNMQNNKKDKKLITDGNEEKKEEYNPMLEANKSMSWFMPLMSISIAIIAPLGLALYWLMNNLLSITERIVLNKVLKKEEEATENA